MVGLKSESEISTSQGRIDLVVEVATYIYIMEIKFNDSPDRALAQIEERRYFEKFLYAGKKIILVGLSFNRQPNKFDITYAVKNYSEESNDTEK